MIPTKRLAAYQFHVHSLMREIEGKTHPDGIRAAWTMVQLEYFVSGSLSLAYALDDDERAEKMILPERINLLYVLDKRHPCCGDALNRARLEDGTVNTMN